MAVTVSKTFLYKKGPDDCIIRVSAMRMSIYLSLVEGLACARQRNVGHLDVGCRVYD